MATIEETQLQATAITPNRALAVTFDIPETVPQEFPVYFHRGASEIQPQDTEDVSRRSSGVWTLTPLNGLGGRYGPETSVYEGAIVRASELILAAGSAEVPRSRAITEISGVSASADVVAQGHWFIEKRKEAGGTWTSALSGVPNVYFAPLYNIDRILRTVGAGYDPDTGYMVNVLVRGPSLTHTDYLFGFEFGGPVLMSGPVTGYGRFYVVFHGNGLADLFEHYNGDWHKHSRWRYNAPKDTSGLKIGIQILPHAPGFLEIQTFTIGAMPEKYAQSVYGTLNAIKVSQGDTSGASTHLYSTIGRPPQAFTAQNIARSTTGAGGVAFDLRRDLMCSLQVSRLIYPATGTLTDQAFTLPYGYGAAHIVRPFIDAYNFQKDLGDPGSVVTSATSVIQTASGAALPAATETHTWRGVSTTMNGFTPPGGVNAMRCVITLANTEVGVKTHTPSLRGYKIIRNGHQGERAPGEKRGGKLVRFSMTGAGFEPEQETANLQIEDDFNQLEFLRSRGRVSVRVETPVGPDPNKRSIVWEGYTGRVVALRKGKRGETYPSEQWRHLDIDGVGKWDRFRNRFFYQRLHFGNEDGHPFSPNTTTKRPWKITDIIRFCLAIQGYEDDQLDIFDDPQRIHFGPHQTIDSIDVPPGTEILAYCKTLARDWLNAFLYWDANARPAGGTRQGMWRLLRPPTGTETPVWHFTSTPPAASGPRLRADPRGYQASGPYPRNISPLYGDFRSYVIPPEGNVLTVSGGVPNDGKNGEKQIRETFFNAKSWNAPTHSYADETDIDYLGEIVPIEYVDITLGVGMPIEAARAAVRFVGTRIFNLACRGQKWFDFESIFVLLDATKVEPTIYTNPLYTHRPLRPGDLVTLEGLNVMIHSCQPMVHKDVIQRAHYECVLVRPELVVN